MQYKNKEFVPSIELVTETMADIYMSQGLYREAAEIYKKMLTLNPDNEVIRNKLEKVYRLMGRTEEGGCKAREVIERMEGFLKRIKEKKEAYEKGIGNTWS